MQPPVQRLTALFLCLLILSGIAIPPVSVYAAQNEADAIKPAITGTPHKSTPPDTKTEMKQDYAGPIPESKADFKVADTGNLSAVNFNKPTTTAAEPSVDELMKKQNQPIDRSKQKEIVGKRDAKTEVFRNNNGSFTQKQYLEPKFYKAGGQWKTIDASLIEDKNAADSGNILGKLYGQAQSAIDSEQAFTVKDNDWQARFSPSDFDGGMVRVKKGNDQVGFSPVGAKRVAPVVTKDAKGNQTVHYYDLWPGVNVEYVVTTGKLKENIVIKDKQSTASFSFKIVGASLAPHDKLPGGFKVQGVLDNKFSISPINLILNKYGFVDQDVFKQDYKNGVLQISVDKTYLQTLPDDAFPAAIDPSLGDDIGSNYVDFKSNGPICYSSTCNIYAGSLNDGTAWRQWRAAVNVPYSFLTPSIDLLGASINLGESADGLSTVGVRPFQPYHASCMSFSCVDWGVPGGEASFDEYGGISVTNIYQTLKNNGDYGGWLMLLGQECGCQSFKSFDPGSYMQFDYNNHPAIPAPEVPAANATVITTEPILGVGTTTDPDSDQVKYAYQVRSTNGVILYQTGLLDQNRLTIPEGLLQDGGSYVWSYAIADPYWVSGWNTGGSLRVDLRTGKDKTSTYDDVGRVSVSLNNGNAFTSVSSHSISALAGSIGLNLDYNSPYASRIGLRAAYYNNYTWSGDPVLRRTEATIDNSWGNGSPAQYVVADDSFSAKYEGYFIAPTTGSYYFGGTHDDYAAITVNNQQVYTSGGCYSGPCYGTAISLTAGQAVPLNIDYQESTGPAYIRIYVKGAVAETILKTEWLRTPAMPTEQTSGLTGHYYKDNGSHDPAQLTEQIMVRQDPAVNFQWGLNPPVPNTESDNFYVRWEGYFLPPADGNYTFGARADDGFRIKVDGVTVADQWTGGAKSLIYGSAKYLTKNTAVPITIEYFENTGDSYMQLYAKTPYNSSDPSSTGTVVESQYLTPGGKVLPAGWSLSADADGNLAYERLEVRQNGDIIMYDADGSTHLFTNTGSGYKPPVNEDATLIRNQDSSYKLSDTDGRMYTFNVDGTLRETAIPIDDRHPAALQYNYATQNGMPKLTEIVDGVTNTRKGNLYYAGDSQCASAPSGFDSAPPANNLCAFVTTDGQRTDFFYTNKQLTRVSLPGDANHEFGYSTDGHGTLMTIRDTLANDAIAAGVRVADSSTLTEIGYDSLARVTSVTAPAPQTGATRSVQTIDYLPNSSKSHISGSAEPNGYSQYIEYDDLLRTTKNCDIAALCTLSEWNTTKDLALSSTDATGLKTTSIYDDEDRPTDSYGPAPASYFGADRKPTSAYVSTVPRTETKFDEGINGTAVAWYNVKDVAGKGTLYGAPKLHTTGAVPTDPTEAGRNFAANAPPITPDTGMDGYGLSATGKARFPQAGTYTFRLWNDDGARLWIDDTLVIDDWNNRTEGTATTGVVANFVAEAGKVYRFRLDYMHVGNPGLFELWTSGPGITDVSGVGNGTSHPAFLNPDYSLTTTAKVYDGTLGNSTTTTNYGSTPELGLAQSTTVDPTGLNLTTSSSYEAAATTGSYLRQTAKFLPGANTAVASTGTQYAYYTATDTKDNPCTTGTTEAYKQGGMLKTRTEPDPDGAGSLTGRVTETIYDDAGKVVATRYNTDSWTCIIYDSRQRPISTTIPAYNGAATRTMQNDYAVGGNPLETTSWDSQGWIVTWTDLLGRTTKYRDVHDDETTTTYDSLGKVTQRVSPLGTETYVYDSLNRVTDQKLDGVTYAHVNYDSFSRVDNVTYPSAGSMKLQYARDVLGHTNAYTYILGNGTTTISDMVTQSQSDQVMSDVVASGASSLWYTYGYDTANRLTSANIGPHSYNYGFGAESGTCSSVAGNNTNAGKNSNRTTQTIDGTTTTFCYDQADRLMGSSNALYNGGDYDTHGNMMSVGTGTTPLRLCFDSSDRNTCMTQRNSSGTGVAMYYNRDVQGRIVARFKNTLTNWTAVDSGDYYYGFTSSGDTPDFVRDVNWAVSEKNLQLPGGVLLTIKPLLTGNAQKQYSLPNIHGDVLLTADAAGANTSTGNGPASTFTYDPFGQALSGSTLPVNADQASYGWVGKDEKLTETIFALVPIQMGARVYIPALARFLQVDPIEGGTPSSYVYPPDPVNDFDLDGNLTMPGQYIASPVIGMHQDCTLHGYGACATHFGIGGTIATGMILAPEIAAPTATWFSNRGAAVSSAAGSKLMNSKTMGVTSNKFGNPSIANSKGIRSVVSGSLNQASRVIRAGWSVGPTKKGPAPVFRIKIKSAHIDLFHGRFF